MDSLGLVQNDADVIGDVYDTASVLPEPGSFDRVLVSWGALCWLPDIAGWAKVVAHFLKPGGRLALAESHPAGYVFDSETKIQNGMPGWFTPYLGRDTLIDDRTQDYADPDAVLTNTRTHEWVHPISDIIMGSIDAGLRLDRFWEHDTVRWPMFDCLVPDRTGGYRWPDKPWLPLSYSLRASKPV